MVLSTRLQMLLGIVIGAFLLSGCKGDGGAGSGGAGGSETLLEKLSLSTPDAAITLAEGSSTNLILLLNREAPLDVNVEWSLNDSSGAFVANQGTLTFAKGQNSKMFSVTSLDNAIYDPNREYTLTLTGSPAIFHGSVNVILQIGNDDAQPQLTLAAQNSVVAEGQTATLVGTLSNASSQNVIVQWSASGGTAVAGTDYSPASGIFTIPAGSLTASFDIAANNNVVAEADKTFQVAVTQVQNATDQSSPVTMTIQDNDVALSVTLNQASSQNDPTGIFPVVYDVVFSQAIDPATLSVSDFTQSGTATGVTWTLADSGDHTTFSLQATGATAGGTLLPSLPQGVATSAGGVANNASTSADNSVTLDLVGPTSPTLAINSGALYTQNLAVSLALSAVGADQMYITNTAACASGGSWATYSTSSSWNLAQSNASNSVYVKFKDNAGNESPCVSASILHDNLGPNAPTGLALGGVPDDLTVSPTFSWTGANDNLNGSGVLSYQARVIKNSDSSAVTSWAALNSGSPIKNLTLSAGTVYKLEVRGIDAATNSGTSAQSASFTAVSANLCPIGYVRVTSLSGYTTSDFCVAKFEAKQDSTKGISKAYGLPWVNVDRASAIAACQANGTGYDLISNAQWQSLARNIEGVAWNWDGGVVGSSGGLSRTSGKSEALEASADASPCANQGVNCDLSTFHAQRRVHKLSNGQYVWDASGNVAEWIKDSNATTYSNSMISQVASGAVKTQFGPAGDYSLLASSPYGGLGEILGGNAGGITRSGSWIAGNNSLSQAGLFSANTGVATSATDASLGFRCSYRILDLTYTSVTNAAVSTATTSNAVTATHISGTRSVSVSGGGSPQLVINGSAAGSSASLNPNDTLAVRLTSSATNSATLTATVVVDSTSVGTFAVTTAAAAAAESAGYIVISQTAWNGNLGGRTGANAKCVTELQGKDWLGKANVTVDAAHVFALLCDNSTCTNLAANTKYYYAQAGSASGGGASFTTDSSGAGPSDSLSWSHSTAFGGSFNIWTNRGVGTGTKWSTSKDRNDSDKTCSGYTSSSSGSDGVNGRSAATDSNRWNTDRLGCSSTARVICFVNP